MPRLAEALLRRGWTEADVRKLLGENFLRLFQEVWRG
jgi:membrane dipeptidase